VPELIVDRRSDTVTRPSAEMRRIIAEAEVGDAVLGDDPSAEALERYAAELLGMERALFFPSGIMANQAALLVLAQPGNEVVIDAGGHILNYEEGAAAAWAGVQLRAVQTRGGLLSAADVSAAIRPPSRYLPQTSLIALENTHNSAGGRVLPVEAMREIAELAHERGVAVHLDGARLPNAAVAAGRPMAEWSRCADTVMVALSKGLGAPIGSVLAGSGEIMERAWRVRRRLGGGMRQIGMMAAAGLYALRTNLDRIAEDHVRARRLAAFADAAPGLTAEVPETNIVMIDLIDPAISMEAVLAELEARGVRLTQFGPRRLRAITHMDVDDRRVEHAGAVLGEVASQAVGAA
jgi:threonine aldolase